MARRASGRWIAIWLLVSVIWGAGVAYMALQAWPHVPLDLSPADPQLKAAYDRAVMRLITQALLTGLLPPLLLLGLGWLLTKRSRPS